MEKERGFEVKFQNESYDIKSFLSDHPGGIQTLKYFENKSIQEVMKKYEHSKNAYHILKDFKLDDKSDDNHNILVDSNLTGDVSKNGRIITKEDDSKDAAEIAFLEELEVRFIYALDKSSEYFVVVIYIELYNEIILSI